MILDCKVGDRNNLPSDLESIYDPPESGDGRVGYRISFYSNNISTDTPGIKITLPRQRSTADTIDSYLFIKG